jgi:hypothetical protein
MKGPLHTFFAAILLICAAQSASAATILITCQGGSGPPVVYKLDMDNKTVLVSWNHKLYPILITDDEISWDENPDLWARFTLNRVTLNLHGIYTAGGMAGSSADSQCLKSDKQL